MRFDEFNKHLKEYGMRTGYPSNPSAQQTVAKVKAQSPTPAPAQRSAATTATTAIPNKTPAAAPQTTGKELQKDDEFADAEGNTIKVISPMGQGRNTDAVVVQNVNTGEFYALDPNEKISSPVKESRYSKGSIKRKLKKHNKKLDKINRSQKFNQQSEVLHEIDFNNATVIKGILDAPISCGFEAETIWTDMENNSDDDNDMDWVDDLNWHEIETMIRDQQGDRTLDRLSEDFHTWIHEDIVPEMANDLTAEYVRHNINDEDKMYDFVLAEHDWGAIEDYKADFLDGLSDEEQENYESYDNSEWAGRMVKEDYLAEFKDWLEEEHREEAQEEAAQHAFDEKDMDDFMKAEYRYWSRLLSSSNIYLYNENRGSGGIEALAERVEDWITGNSAFTRLEWSEEYHGTEGGTEQDYWRLEPDGSIEGDGLHAEIISPVYSSIREMLDEMKKLFEFFEENDVETNDSTGLHVTMSLSEATDNEPNYLKMALLMGDVYVHNQFDRLNNSYTESQQQTIYNKIKLALKSYRFDSSSFSEIEKIMSSFVSRNRVASMNIKSLENPSGNGLFEFRIMGNQRYHDSEDFKKVAKTVIRYGVVLQAGYDKDAYNRDYAKAIMRAMGETTKVSPEEKLHKDSVGQSATLRLIDSIVTTTEDRTEMARMLKRFKASSQYQRSLKPYYGILDKLTELFHENALMGGKLGGINPVVPPQVSRLMRLSFKEAGSSLSEITSDGNDYFTSVEKRIISALAGKITMPKGIKINYDRYRDRMYLQKSEKDKLDTGLPIDPNKLKVVWEADMREVTVAYRRTLEYAKWRNQNTPDLSSPEEINDAIKTIAAFKEKYGFDPIPAVKDSVNMDQTLTDNMYVAIGVSPPLIRMFRDQGIYIGEAKISPFDKLPIMEQLKRIDKIDEKKLNAIHKKLVEKK